MPRTFDDIYREVAGVEYGIRPNSPDPYLLGDYWLGHSKTTDADRVEIIWKIEHPPKLGGLVRAHILPRAVEIYAKEEAVNLTVYNKPLDLTIGHMAIESTDLTADSIVGIIQPPLSLEPLAR